MVYDPSSSVKPHVYDKDRRYALLVVDMLYDFVYGKIKCDRSVPMIPRTAQLLDAAHEAGVPVFYVNDSHVRKDFEMYRWGEHAMRGSRGARVIGELRPRKRDSQVPKQTYSSFYGTRLDKELKRTYDGKGSNTLVLTGLHADLRSAHLCRRVLQRLRNPGRRGRCRIVHRTRLSYRPSIREVLVSDRCSAN
jgi:nicotinamidase-related amidase